MMMLKMMSKMGQIRCKLEQIRDFRRPFQRGGRLLLDKRWVCTSVHL